MNCDASCMSARCPGKLSAISAAIGLAFIFACNCAAQADERAGAPSPSATVVAEAHPDAVDKSDVGEVAEKGTVSSKSVISRESIDAHNAQNTFDAIKNVPGVVDANSKGGENDDLQIRGIHLSETSSYRLNGGFPIVNSIAILEYKERIEALKGVGALVFGLAPPAGIINFVTKRASDHPITTLPLSGNQAGQ